MIAYRNIEQLNRCYISNLSMHIVGENLTDVGREIPYQFCAIQKTKCCEHWSEKMNNWWPT